MDDGFEAWARAEIIRFRADAERMERVLELFLASRGKHPSHTNTRTNPTPHIAAAHAAPREKRITKNEPIFQAFDAAGSAGLSLDDVERVARESGLNTNRNALRVLCWNGKKRGRLISIAQGRYTTALKSDATGEVMFSDMPVAPDTNQWAGSN